MHLCSAGQNMSNILIKTHDSESQGQDEAGHM